MSQPTIAQFIALIIVTIALIIGAKSYAAKNPNSAADAPKTTTAVITTNKGEITLELFDTDAPKTVENFKRLVERGYYNGVTFHRVVKDFVIQGGDPTGKGSGGESAFGADFEDEINPRAIRLSDGIIKQYQAQGYKYRYDLNSHEMVVGSLAMANSGPNTNSSQFFIVTGKDQPGLNGKHTVFGRVVKGQDVVDAIAAVAADEEGKPNEDVIMEKVVLQN